MDVICSQKLNRINSTLKSISNQLGMAGTARTAAPVKVNTISGTYLTLTGAQTSNSLYHVNLYQVTPGGSYKISGQLFSNPGEMTVCYYYSDQAMKNLIGKSDIGLSGTTTINNYITIPSNASYLAINNISWYPDIYITVVVNSTDKLNYQNPYDSVSGYYINTNGVFTATANYTIRKYAVTAGKNYNLKGGDSGNPNAYAIYAFYSNSACTNVVSIGRLGAGWNEVVDLTIQAPTGAYYMAVTGYNGNTTIVVSEVVPMSKLEIVDDILMTLNPLYGKKIGICGDSMSKGNGTYDGNCWGERLARRNNMTIDNQALNGKYLTQSFSDSVVGGQMASLSSDCDYIVIYGGNNDITNQVAIGDLSTTSTDISTLTGAMNTIIPYLLTKSPKAKLCFITPWQRFIRTNNNGTITYSEPWSGQAAWINAIETMCGYYGIPCFNSMKRGGIYWKNDAQRALYMSNATYPYGDSTHLTDTGLDYVSSMYERFLRSL